MGCSGRLVASGNAADGSSPPILIQPNSLFPVSPTLAGNQGRGSRVVGVASDDSSPSPSIMERDKLELGNYIYTTREAAEQNPYPIVHLCVADCLRACERYRIEPVGSFQMSYHAVGLPWDIVTYLFNSDE